MKSVICFLLFSMLLVNCGENSFFTFDEEKSQPGALTSLIMGRNGITETNTSVFANDILGADNIEPSIPNSLVSNKSGANSITLTWKASKGSVKEYEVSKDNGLTWIKVGNVLTYTFKNLKVGKTYKLKVRARNKNGMKGNIANTSLKLGNAKPSIPGNFTTNIRNSNNVDLTWTASTDEDGSIKEYEVSKDNGASWLNVGNVLTYSFNGLTIGTTYNFKVRAKDNENTYSDAFSTTLKLGNLRPTIPTNFLATISGNNIVLNWTASTDEGSIADYEVSKDNGITWVKLNSGNSLTYTFINLTVGTTYNLKVRAKDDEGAYSNIASSSLKLGNLPPTTPTSFVATPNVSGRSITLSWNASTDEGSVSDYEVSKDNGNSWVSTSNSRTYTFNVLNIGTTYSFKVRAKDDENTYGNAASATLKLGNLRPTIPTTFFSCNIWKLILFLSWAASTDEGSISDYEVSKDNGNTWASFRN